MNKAVELWKRGRDALFDFCDAVAGLSRDDILSLSETIRRSPSLIYGYAKVGRLYREVLARNPSDGENLRENLEVSFWTPVARLWDNGSISIEEAVGLLNEAMEGYSVEEWRAFISETFPSTFRPWARVITYIERHIVFAPMLGVGDARAKRLVELGREMIDILTELDNDEEDENKQ